MRGHVIMCIYELIYTYTHATLSIMPKYLSALSEHVRPTHTRTHTYKRGDVRNRRRHGYGPFVPSYRRLISMFVLIRAILCHRINR